MKPESPLQIRDARRSDAPAIVEFNIAMALETEGKRLETETATQGVDMAFDRPAYCRYFIAEVDGVVIGQCMITYEWSDWRAGLFWWIQSVYVAPDYRGRGVFKALYRHLYDLAQQSGESCGIRLYVEAHNAPAIATYEKLGMKPSGHTMYEVDWS